MASALSIFCRKPPFTYFSAVPPILKTPVLTRCRPVRAAATAPKPRIMGVAMKEASSAVGARCVIYHPSRMSFQPSKLGTKDHWDNVYEEEIQNFEDIGDEGEVW